MEKVISHESLATSFFFKIIDSLARCGNLNQCVVYSLQMLFEKWGTSSEGTLYPFSSESLPKGLRKLSNKLCPCLVQRPSSPCFEIASEI